MTGTSIQATVRRYDADTGAGDVLLDDGTLVGFPGQALAGTGLRRLRSGQRVRLRLDADGRVLWLTILTLPDP